MLHPLLHPGARFSSALIAILFPKRADLICIFNQRARMIALVDPPSSPPLPSLTGLHPRAFKTRSRRSRFPPWEGKGGKGKGTFEGNSIFAISPGRLSPESGGKRLPVCFPRTLSTSTFLLDSSRYSPFPACSLPSNSFYFSFLFPSFFFSSFLSPSSYFFLSPSFLLPRIDRKRTRFRLLASNFLISRSRLLRKGAIVSLNQPFVPRYVLTNLRSIIPLFDDLFINVNRKLFLT